MPGSEAGQVVTPGSAMRIRAWALEPDRRELQVGQAVRLSFDALPGRSVDGHISAIAGAPEPRAEWGSGSYFVVDKIGRASCRERVGQYVEISVVAVPLKKNKK